MTELAQGFAMIPRSMLYDRGVPLDAKVVYLILSSHVGGNETAWPSHRRIAELAPMGLSSVKRQLAWLRKHGYITWKQRVTEDKAQLSNDYVLLVGNAPSPAKPGSPEGATPSPQTATPGPEGATPRPPAATPSPTVGDEGESLNESQGRQPVRLPPNVDAIFDQFWEIYPRREGKGAAKAAFVKVLRRGITVDMLMHGATRLRDDPNLPDKQFICHPTTWLNQQRWGDDPLPTRTDGRQERRPAPRPAEGLTLQLPINSEAS